MIYERSLDQNLKLKQKIFALAESFTFLMLFFILAWYFESLQGQTYGWYSKVSMIILGFIGIALHKRPRDYGLVPKNIKFSLRWSAYIFALFLGFGLLAVLISAFLGFANLEVSFRTLIIDFIWYFIFVGFAEELFFRGYIQSRLNEVFTKKYRKILGIEFEWTQGTLITAIFFFGFPHLLVMINPFTGRVELSVFILAMALVFAPFLGIILGVIREKTGCILIATVLHAMLDFVVFGIGRISGIMLSNIAVAIALFIFFSVIFERILQSEV